MTGAAAAAGSMGLMRHTLAGLADAAWSPQNYGDLLLPDERGVQVPPGFAVTMALWSGEPVPGTSYRWHAAPDGGACIPTDGGGHVYVSNSEVGSGRGGVGAVWFAHDGSIVDADGLLDGTSRNCAGGTTPWGTWLSCEESGDDGQVWECDPVSRRARVRAAMGSFNHEAVAVDVIDRCCYLTEDEPDGRLYRFVPDRWPSMRSGRLQAARLDRGAVTWVDVESDRPARGRSTTAFDGGEGLAIDGRSLFIATKGDRIIRELDLVEQRMSVFFSARANPGSALTHVDNLVIHPWNGHLFVAEDGGNVELCMLTRTGGTPAVSAVVRFDGHDGSEVTGPAFSPDGRHLYVSSQRGRTGAGLTVRVTGPWADWIGRIDNAGTGTSQAFRLGG